MGFFKTLFTGKEDTAEQKAEERRQGDFDMFKYDGIQALRIGQVDFGIACLQRAISIHDDIEARQHLANALLRKDDLDGAIKQLQHLASIRPDEPSVAITLAELYFQQEQYEEALSICNDATDKFADMAQPHFIKAKVKRVQGDLLSAVAEATIAISKDDNFVNAYLLRAGILADMGQNHEAEADVAHILSLSPDDEDALAIKAKCCAAAARADEAEECYRHIIELNPFNAEAYLHLGQLLMQQGRTDEATHLAEEALQYAPQQMETINGKFESEGRD
ncbi:MAG: tetratricopeptide repeat protein [Bacteroidaceae bacterium]|nr:tetratricopeptide repeat protein [Bacteroidaceae bacterium]